MRDENNMAGRAGQGFFKEKCLFAIFVATMMKLKRNLPHGLSSSLTFKVTMAILMVT